MVLSTWKSILPLFLFASLFLYEEWISFPSCQVVPNPINGQYDVVEDDEENHLKVMMVANLLLLGSEASFFNLHFRDYYMSKFFKKSFHSLKPDMLLVLGDVSARGLDLSKSKWISVVHQFHKVLGPFVELPFHVVLGDRDIGECSGLDARSVFWVARNFPGLDSAGCGTFEIGNVSFVSLNAVALLCGDTELRFSVERVIESESIDLRMEAETNNSKRMNDNGELRANYDGIGWRNNAMSSGSGPILLLHFPLHRTGKENCRQSNVEDSDAFQSRGFISPGPYELLQTVPPNATEYIFQALKPRIIFSAHTHEFCDHIHSDGTREVTIPAMTWKARDDPGFVIATFQGDGKHISVSYCSLAKESHVLIAYALIVVLLLTICIMIRTPDFRCLG